MTVRVSVLGAAGRMGATAVQAVTDADDLELAAALGRGDDLAALVDGGAGVMVDLTTPDSVMANLEFAIAVGIHCGAALGLRGASIRRRLVPVPDPGRRF